MHQHLHSVGAFVHEQIGVMDMRFTKTLTTRPTAVSAPVRISNGSMANQAASIRIT
jgi:hypothetical protein